MSMEWMVFHLVGLGILMVWSSSAVCGEIKALLPPRSSFEVSEDWRGRTICGYSGDTSLISRLSDLPRRKPWAAAHAGGW